MKSLTAGVLGVVTSPFRWGLQSRWKYFTITTVFTGVGWFIFFAAILYSFNAFNAWMVVFLVIICALMGIAVSAITWWLCMKTISERLKERDKHASQGVRLD